MKRIRAAAIIVNNGKILLIHRINRGQEYYVFPGGGVEAGETFAEAALREVREETSLKIEIERLLYHHIYDDGNEQFFYLGRYLSGEPKLGDGNELREMAESDVNFYEPVWREIRDLPMLLLYPLEIKDWLIDDLKSGFGSMPKEASLKTSELRQSL